MKKTKLFKAVIMVMALVLLCSFVFSGCGNKSPADDEGETWPARDIRLIVHTDAGGGSDTNIRKLQPFLEAELGVNVIIDNRPGAASLLGPKMVSESEPDGYTIGMAGSPNTELGLLTREGYLDGEAISFVAGLTQDTAAIMVAADAPYDTFEEFIAYCKEHPGEVNAAVGTATSDNYLGLRLIEEAAGIDLNIVSFGGGSSARLALLGGHVDVLHASYFASKSIWENVKCLAVHWDNNNWTDETNSAPTVISVVPEVAKASCGTMDTLIVPAAFKEQYPDRYKILCDAIEAAVNNPEFQALIEGDGTASVWSYTNADDMNALYANNLELFEQYASFFNEEVEEGTVEK